LKVAEGRVFGLKLIMQHENTVSSMGRGCCILSQNDQDRDNNMKKNRDDDSDNELAEAIGQRIKQRRKELDMTAVDLSKDSGIARSSISHYELGRYLPRAGEIQKICEALDITPSFLIEGTDDLARTKSIGSTFLETDNETELVMRATLLFMMLQERDRNAILGLAISLIEGRVGRDKMVQMSEFADAMAETMKPAFDDLKSNVEANSEELTSVYQQSGFDLEE
jgi:transcriptional regulator with XRE-family HTH domain